MEQWQIYMLVFAILQTLFVFAIGSCVGSLINVLVYRMPLGAERRDAAVALPVVPDKAHVA
jgi:prepilin signal peptidase PulO-like enzyme (type II secretory pathway)